MQRCFVYIINPISGTRNKGLLQQKIESFAQGAGFPYHIFPSAADGDYTFLKAHIAQKGVTDVVIAGGDGTINAALDALRQQPVQFGILPCGSGNGLAFTTGLSKNIDAALQVILAGKSAPTDAFLVNGRFACMLCGLGFDAQVAHAFAAEPQRGLSTYIKKSVQHFFSAPAYPFTIQSGSTNVALDAFFISIANSNQFGNNFTIAPKASLTDGLLDVVIVTKQNKLTLLLHTLKQVAGWNNLQEIELISQDTKVIYFQTSGLTITNNALAPMHIDGDPCTTAAAVNVQLLKGCFQLIYP